MNLTAPLIRVFQIHYHPDQIESLDPAFIPYDNAGDTSPLLEFNVFRKIAAAGLAQGADLWGAVSWKFGSKTGLKGESLLSLIRSNPGYDVYFCNPFPEIEALYHNLWRQGETAHPDFLNLSFDFLQAAGLPTGVIDELCPSWLFAATNCFVATPEFWQDYLTFINRSLEESQRNLLPPARAVLFSSLADKRGVHAAATYLPFIIERLFAVFLASSEKCYKSYKYYAGGLSLSDDVDLKMLCALKDRAVQAKDSWLAQCWSSYRNTYSSLVYGRHWSRKSYSAAIPGRNLFCNNRATVIVQSCNVVNDEDGVSAPIASN